MAVDPTTAVNPASFVAPDIDGAGVAYALAQQEFVSVPTFLNMQTWLEVRALQALFGRKITALGLAFVAKTEVSPPFQPFPDGWGPESLQEMAYECCNFRTKFGDRTFHDLPCNLFLDTKKIQRILEVFINPPYPQNNDGLRFEIYSCVPMPYGDYQYSITAIIKALFPPNGSLPATIYPPRGLGLISVQ